MFFDSENYKSSSFFNIDQIELCFHFVVFFHFSVIHRTRVAVQKLFFIKVRLELQQKNND